MTDHSAMGARLIGPGDADRLADLFASLDASRFHPHPFTQDEAERIARYKGRDVYAVLEADGRFVAYGLLRGWDEGFDVPSLGIAVRSDAQRRGYGRGLMTWLAAEASHRGAQRIRLRVKAGNTAARRLYESLSYVYAGEERDELVMILTMPPRPGGMIPIYQPTVGDLEKRYVNEALDSSWISSRGPFVDRFEHEFAAFAGAEHGIGTANGTVSLHLAFVALGIGPGDEVIVPTLTYVASVNAIAYTGATPVFVDSDPATWNLNPTGIAAAITPRTRAIEVVHLYGHPADLDPILEIARRHELAVIEDAAESHGARYKGKPVGALGTIGSFSFFGNKIITTGEGGMLVTNDAELASRARHYRGQGVSPTRTYWHDVLGFNYRMTNIAAALGCAQLERVESTLAAKRQIAAWYRERLEHSPHVTLQDPAPWADPVHWMNCILVPRARRNALIAYLAQRGIETRPFFYPAHTLPMYASSQAYPVAERLGASGINLPSWPGLTESQVDRISASLLAGLRELGDDENP